MKHINLSLISIFAMSSLALAGGDIAPVEPVVETPVVIESTGNFYLGLAYGYLNDQTDVTATAPSRKTSKKTVIDDNFNEVILQAGYNFNPYIAVEGRYWFGMSSTINYSNINPAVKNSDTTIDAWGIYVKPQYPVTEEFNVYALLGYGSADITIDDVPTNGGLQYVSDSVDGFSWGVGASYAITESVSLFIDYVSIYNDDDDSYNPSTGYNYNIDNTIDSVNFGVTYNF